MRIRVRGPTGVATLNVENNWTIRDLKVAIETTLNVPVHSQILLNGFPPKNMETTDSSRASDYLKSGDAIVVRKKPGSTLPVPPVQRPTETARVQRPEAPALERARQASIASQGDFVIREVPDDNSCLFSSVNGIRGRPQDSVSPLRRAVANAIRSDKAKYNEAILARSNEAYCEWIMTENAWGGPIELAILAEHLKMEIGAYDVRTMRLDRYGQDNGYPHIGFLLYDGLHYNYMALALGGNTSNAELDVTQFDSNDIYARELARKIAHVQHTAKEYTVTATFTVQCDMCGVKLKGERDAVKHGNATGHSRFSEAK